MFPDLRLWHLPLALVLAPIAIVGWYWLVQPTFRFQLSMDIEVDGKVHTGSSIIQVSYSGGGPYERRWHTHVRGVAPIVDLGRHGTVVVLFEWTDHNFFEQMVKVGRSTSSSGGDWPRLIGDLPLAVYNRPPDQMTSFLKKTEVPFKIYPALAWLPHRSHWTAAEVILPEEMPETVGAGVRMKRMTIEPASWAWLKTTIDPTPEWLLTLRHDRRTSSLSKSDKFNFDPLQIESGYRR